MWWFGGIRVCLGFKSANFSLFHSCRSRWQLECLCWAARFYSWRCRKCASELIWWETQNGAHWKSLRNHSVWMWFVVLLQWWSGDSLSNSHPRTIWSCQLFGCVCLCTVWEKQYYMESTKRRVIVLMFSLSNRFQVLRGRRVRFPLCTGATG